MHSALEVGLDSANTIGRSLSRAIACSTSGVNVPPTAATPMIAVGLSAAIAAAKSPIGACSCAYGQLVLGEIGAALHDQAARVDEPAAPRAPRPRQALRHHRRDHEVGDAGRGLAGAEEQQLLVGRACRR